MATFAELRERLSLDGRQFERVCKWFLETDPRYSDRLVNVWLWDDWPGRWGPDCGIDLVAQDRDDKNWLKHTLAYKTSEGPQIDYLPVTITRWPPEKRVY